MYYLKKYRESLCEKVPKSEVEIKLEMEWEKKRLAGIMNKKKKPRKKKTTYKGKVLQGVN